MKSSLERILKAIGKQKSLVSSKNIEQYVTTNKALLYNKILEHKDEQKAKFVKGYMRSENQFYGINIPIIHKMISQNINKSEDFEKNFLLSEQLIKSNVFELKIGGIDILTLFHSQINIQVLDIIRQIIKDGHIVGWGLCDSLALPLKQASLKQGQKFDDCLIDWKYDQKNDWVRRTALVSFVKKAKHGDNKPNYEGFMDKMFGMCQECVQYQNRFNQLGVGWLLREMSITDKQGVKKFIIKHYDTISREGIRYAIQKMEAKQREEIMKFKKEETPNSKSIQKPKSKPRKQK